MNVGELEIQPLVGTGARDSLADAADRMRFYDVGSLAVIEEDRLVGIVTERDIARAAAEGIDPSTVAVSSFMTPEPQTISVEASLHEAAELMLSIGVRHLPVMKGSFLVGMISMRDLLAPEMSAGDASRTAVGSRGQAPWPFLTAGETIGVRPGRRPS